MIAKRFLLPAMLACVMACQSSKDTKAIGVVNDVWLFSYDSTDVGVKNHWYSDSTDRSAWVHARSGYWSGEQGETYDGVAWYASTFAIRDTAEQHSIFFGGVDDDADVWVNGSWVGSHAGYDESFFFDIPNIRFGQNSVVVRVVDRGSPGGLYKPVRIVQSSEVKELLKSQFADKNARPSADWVRDAVIYEVYLRSFSREGTFKGLEKKLPELKSLGVTVLWLMPMHPVGELARKGKLGSPYSVQDYYAVNPEFGTLDDFKSLVTAVHKLGLKIIIDLVANHASWDSKLMFDHPEWFARNKEGAIVSPNADWSDVAQLDYHHHELRKYMINMMAYWVRDIGIDGYRCDVADLVPLSFWETARQELDEIKPVMMLAEGKNPGDHIKAFDLTYSWNFYKVLHDVVRGTKSVNVLDQQWEREQLEYPKNALRMRFISNHDKNVQDDPAVRWYTKAGTKAAVAWLFTFPGVPLIYNGDEIGNAKKLSLVEKVAIDWSNGSDFSELYTTLAHVRNEHEALRRGDYRRLWCSDSTRVFAFQRRAGNDIVDAVINFSTERKRIKIESDHDLIDVISGSPRAVEKKRVWLELPPYGFSILTPVMKGNRK